MPIWCNPPWKVWDDMQGEGAAWTVNEFNYADDVAVYYAETDVDGRGEGLYTDKHGMPLRSLKQQGHKVYVRDSTGYLTTWKVGVVEFEPIFDACSGAPDEDPPADEEVADA